MSGRTSDRPRILLLCARHPYPATRGDQRRVLHFAQGLGERAEVALACFGAGSPLPFGGVRVEAVSRGLLPAVAANVRTPDPLTPLQVRLYLDSRMRALVARELERFAPHVVHATLARMAPYLPARGPHRHLDLVDALSLNMASRASASALPGRFAFGLEARLMRLYEARAARQADSCSVVSDADRLGGGGLAHAEVVPNGVDLAAFPFSSPQDRLDELIFFGNLGYFHNLRPAAYVAREVLPEVRREHPSTRLRIVGARPAATVARLGQIDGVEVMADVPDMALELRRAAVAVVPMFSGSGMKNKVLEAFCSGTPVVTNRAGIKGVKGAVAGRHYLEGETPSALASACSRLLRDAPERVRLAEEALALVRREFTWERQVEALIRLYGLAG